MVLQNLGVSTTDERLNLGDWGGLTAEFMIRFAVDKSIIFDTCDF